MAVLQVLNGLNPGQQFPLDREKSVMGRSPECDIVLDVGAVSRFHAQVINAGNDYFVEDLKSRNGTYVNGELVHGRRQLKDRDQLKLCDLLFSFHYIVPGAPLPMPRAPRQKLGPETVDSLIDLLLSSQHVNFRGTNSASLQSELLNVQSATASKFQRAFRRVVVFDADDGKSSPSAFDMDRLLLAIWKRLSAAFELPCDEMAFHPEQIAQALKSEQPALLCLLNVQHLSNRDFHCLRGLGFTQEHHYVLYVGANPNLGTISVAMVSNQAVQPPVPPLFDDDEPTATSIMSKLDVSSDDSGLRVTVNPEVKLRAMMEITHNLAGSLALEDVLPKILDSLFKIFIQADRGFIVLRDSANGPLIPMAVRHRREEDDGTIRISRTVINQAMNTKEAFLSADAATDSRFQMSESIADFRIRSMMCAPLIDSTGRAMGAIQIDTLDQRSRFAQDDLDVLASVATQAAFSIENAKLHETLLKHQERERSLELAANVQRGFLPKERPVVTGYEFCDHHEAADFVGGDFFAYIPLDQDRLVLALGDVAGRGFPAALMMARLCPTVRYQLRSQPSLPLAMAAINRDAVEASDEQRFVTLLLAELNARTHTITVVNAGHLAPLICRASGEIETIGENLVGLPAGVDANCSFEAASLQMNQHDRLFLFTDGLAEALNGKGELYGMDRLRRFLGGAKANLGDTVNALLDDAHDFAGGNLQDDFCLVACQRIG